MKRIKMNTIHIGVLCLMMAFILGISCEATGQDTDAGGYVCSQGRYCAPAERVGRTEKIPG